MRKPVKLFSWGQKLFFFSFSFKKNPSVSKALQLYVSVSSAVNVLENKVSQWNSLHNNLAS